MSEEIIVLDKVEVRNLIRERKIIQLRDHLTEMYDADIAELMDDLNDKVLALLLFRMLPKLKAVEVFSFLSIDNQREIINAISEDELPDIIDNIFFDDVIDMIEEMPAEFVNRVLINIDPNKRKLVNQFLKYPEESAGSLMTIEYVRLTEQMTVAEALHHIREIGLKKETIYTCYITNMHEKLIGIVSLRALVTEEPDKKLTEIMDKDVIMVSTHDDQELVADMFKRYDLLAMPVVDHQGRLTGIITVDDIIDVMEQEATEDFQIMAAMTPSETEYLDTNVFVLARHRVVWLLVLLISATFTGSIMKNFSNTLESLILLGMFIPMLMDTGGNAGSQSSTLIIRGLATGNIKLTDALRVLKKEFYISLICGIILSMVNFLRIIVFETQVPVLVALTVSLTLISTVVMAKVIGGLLPIAAKKLKLDPAIMAGPLITTVVDAMSLIIYFNVAQAILGIA
ncbi:MAG TPA: magnesium transporter [Dysgonamonadaceae bacterium]|nr:magnesium transporter [Dysgonamonadaceae bacterium]